MAHHSPPNTYQAASQPYPTTVEISALNVDSHPAHRKFNLFCLSSWWMKKQLFTVQSFHNLFLKDIFSFYRLTNKTPD